MNKQTITIIILSILLVGTLGYIGYDKYSEPEQIELVQYGYYQAILQVAQLVSTCEQVPLTIDNQTINLIAVECLGGQNGK